MNGTGLRLPSLIDPNSSEFHSNRAVMLEALSEVQQLHASLLQGGGDKYVQRHRNRGKLLARERIRLLLDADSPFLEIMPLAGWGTDDPIGAGLITGIGVINDVECVLIVNDPTVRGGTSSPTTVRKTLRAMDISSVNRMPLIHLTESGGAELPKQAEIFNPGGATFRSISRISAAGIPTVAVVFGSSTAGGAYVPGMSDYTVFVKEGAKVFLGGPPLVKMAIDEDADEEELGGAEMHSRVSGLSDYLAADERDALRICREIIGHLGWRKLGPGPSLPDEPPSYDAEELLGIHPADPKLPFEIREIIARVVDGSRFEEFKPLYGGTLVTGWASIHGFEVGIVANNGILFSEESQKGAQFIQLCNQIDTPILFIQNITGFMVGTRYEQGGIIKDGAKMINAVSNSDVPHLTLMVGASYGAGNYAMSGRAYEPRFVFSWPSHRIAVMGGRQLAGVMSIVRRTAAERRGVLYDDEADKAMRTEIEHQIEHESSALFATGHLWDDGIIDPRQTRTALGFALSAVHNAPMKGRRGFAVFRM